MANIGMPDFTTERPTRIPSSFQEQKTPRLDPVSKIAAILSLYPSRPALAAAIISGQHIYSSSSEVPFSRTLLWKTALLQIDTVHSASGKYLPHFNLSPLREHRKTYADLITNIGVPWHLLPKDSVYYKAVSEDTSNDQEVEEDLSNLTINRDRPLSIHKKKLKSSVVAAVDDPLSCDIQRDSKTAKKQETDLNVLLMIIGDVERLFPEHPQMFIESERDKILMIEILYRYSKWINTARKEEGKKQIGYVQGMHELCGVIYAVLKVELIDEVVYDTLNADITSDDNDLASFGKGTAGDTLHSSKKKAGLEIDQRLETQIKEFLSSKYFAHDVFSMFGQLMSPIIDKYFTSSGIVRESIVFDLKLHHVDLGTTEHPGLASALRDSNIESQLWLTRWFRMILTREVGMAYAVRIWDGLIAYACIGAMSDTVSSGHDISVLLPYVIILLVLRIRSPLLKCLVPCLKKAFEGETIDDTEALALLLHYPASTNSPSRSVSPEFADDETEGEPVLMYRKTRDSKFNLLHRKLSRAIEVPKMPSALDLFSDAAHICCLSDSELSEIGPSLIEKYSKGDIYHVLQEVDKDNSGTPFLDGVLKRTKSWKIPSATSISLRSSSSSLSSSSTSASALLNASDSNRTRLEMKLQQRVRARLRDSSNP